MSNMVAVMEQSLTHDINVQLGQFKRSDEAREKLLLDLIQECQKLGDDLKSAKAQLSAVDAGSFVLVLIDGDGCIFQDALLQAGKEGGGRAAHMLDEEIRQYIANLYPNSGHWRIVVQIYVKMDEIGETLWRNGITKAPRDFRVFAQSFTMSQPAFDFIDIEAGGKEKADWKIREMWNINIRNPSCKHIFLAGCHDMGYTNDLRPFQYNDAVAPRVTLLWSYVFRPVYEEFNGKFRKAQFKKVFRTEGLSTVDMKSGSPPVSPEQSKAALAKGIVLDLPKPAAPKGHTLELPKILPAKKPSPELSVAAPARKTTPVSGGVADGWSAVANKGPKGRTISITPAKPVAAPPQKYILYNQNWERLDIPLKRFEASAFKQAYADFQDMVRKKLVCTNLQLGGKCQNGDYCVYAHDTKLTSIQRVAAQKAMRDVACTSVAHSGSCTNIDCFYGHFCQYYPEGRCRGGDGCKLAVTHGMDTVPRFKEVEDGRVLEV